MHRTAAVLLLLAAVTSAHASSAGLFEKLGQSSDLLKAGRYAEALKLDDAVIGDMIEHYVSGEATTQLFCIAIVHKALAHAGLGQRDDALWYWDLAVSLYPPLAKSEMSDYGAAGQLLRQPRPPDSVAFADRPVAIRKKTDPKFPNQTLNALVEGQIRIEFIIGTNGKARAPRVLETLGAPMLAYATAEAVRSWEFTPSTANGQPVEVRYLVAINYRVR